MAEAQTLSQANCIYDWLLATTTPPCQRNKSHLSVRSNFRESLPQRSLKSYWSHYPDPFDSSDDKLQHYLDGVGHGKNPITTHPFDYYTARNGKEYNPYARRPRRRTRADKYMLEDDQRKRISSKPQEDLPKKSNKRKRQESSGTLLLHRYNADNVFSNRLTLKPISRVGLFSKGRVSSTSRVRPARDLVHSDNVSSHENPSEHLDFGYHGNHNKFQKIKDIQNPRLCHSSHQEDPNKLVSCSDQSPRIDTSPVCNGSIQERQVRVEPRIHPGVDTIAPHSQAHALGTQPQGMSFDTNSEATQKQRFFSHSKSPATVHKILRQPSRNRKTPRLDQVSASNQEIFHRGVEKFCDETDNEKAQLDTKICYQPEIKNARQDPHSLLHHLDDLVQKWKAEMQQVDIGQVSSDTPEAHQDLKSAQEATSVSHTSKKAPMIVSKEQGKAKKELKPVIGHGYETLETEKDVAIEQLDHVSSKADDAGVDANTTLETVHRTTDVLEPPKLIRWQLSPGLAGSFARPISASQPLGIMAAPTVSIYEQQIRDYQNTLTNGVDLSVSPMWGQDIPSRSSLHSYTVMHPINTNSPSLGRYPLRCITSVNSNINNITRASKLPRNTTFCDDDDENLTLFESSEALKSYSMTLAAWNSPVKQRCLTPLQADLRNLEDTYFISDLVSEQSRLGSDTNGDAYRQDYSLQPNVVTTGQGPQNFWTPQKLY